MKLPEVTIGNTLIAVGIATAIYAVGDDIEYNYNLTSHGIVPAITEPADDEARTERRKILLEYAGVACIGGLIVRLGELADKTG